MDFFLDTPLQNISAGLYGACMAFALSPLENRIGTRMFKCAVVALIMGCPWHMLYTVADFFMILPAVILSAFIATRRFVPTPFAHQTLLRIAVLTLYQFVRALVAGGVWLAITLAAMTRLGHTEMIADHEFIFAAMSFGVVAGVLLFDWFAKRAFMLLSDSEGTPGQLKGRTIKGTVTLIRHPQNRILLLDKNLENHN